MSSLKESSTQVLFNRNSLYLKRREWEGDSWRKYSKLNNSERIKVFSMEEGLNLENFLAFSCLLDSCCPKEATFLLWGGAPITIGFESLKRVRLFSLRFSLNGVKISTYLHEGNKKFYLTKMPSWSIVRSLIDHGLVSQPWASHDRSRDLWLITGSMSISWSITGDGSWLSGV